MGWVGVDLDGTLAVHYWPQDGPFGALRIGAPIPAMVARVQGWLAEGREVRVFTARVGPLHPAATATIAQIEEAIGAWCEEHIGVRLPVTAQKDYGLVELWDDRAVRVVQNVGSTCCDHFTSECAKPPQETCYLCHHATSHMTNGYYCEVEDCHCNRACRECGAHLGLDDPLAVYPFVTKEPPP